MATISVTVNTSGIGKKLDSICKNQSLGRFLATEAQKGMDKYVPMRTGALASSATIKPFHVIYNALYAKYVYNGKGKKFRRDKHPLATPEWDDAYAKADIGKLAKSATRFLKKL